MHELRDTLLTLLAGSLYVRSLVYFHLERRRAGRTSALGVGMLERSTVAC